MDYLFNVNLNVNGAPVFTFETAMDIKQQLCLEADVDFKSLKLKTLS